MKKKFVLIIVSVLMAVSASAQFEQDKVYIGGSLSGVDLSYNGLNKLNIGIQAHAGYMVADDLLILGQLGYTHNGNDGMPDKIIAGIGGRYYIEQNGLYLGVNAKLLHANHSYNDIMPGIELGYAFFLSRTVTVEPAIYYDQSFKNHKDYSTIGLKIGIGVYL